MAKDLQDVAGIALYQGKGRMLSPIISSCTGMNAEPLRRCGDNCREELQLPTKAAEEDLEASRRPRPPKRSGRVACFHAKSETEEEDKASKL